MRRRLEFGPFREEIPKGEGRGVGDSRELSRSHGPKNGSEAIRYSTVQRGSGPFPPPQPSSVVGLKVDFDMVLLVVASGLYWRIAERMRGYSQAQARQIFRDLIDMPADVTVTAKVVCVSFRRRAHLPIVLTSGLMDKPVSVPWWNGASLRLTTNSGPEIKPHS